MGDNENTGVIYVPTHYHTGFSGLSIVCLVSIHAAVKGHVSVAPLLLTTTSLLMFVRRVESQSCVFTQVRLFEDFTQCLLAYGASDGRSSLIGS